ncbi:Apoptosis-stimulating of p53 1 [Brachionus plicatilis]|uniref:Apoptosis-stimulating of p53 1 n=1 Tax=Brachionus plicatilis TaxID=10195 RepID=A0A3M7Q7V1_BRAPC|nr:Apoptosis-stimulating of p53 1 [Brachionus plicatilis]
MNTVLHNQPNCHKDMSEMSISELQDIAYRQQQQIEINNQLLQAKEKRLKLLKQEEEKNLKVSQMGQQSVRGEAGPANKIESLKQNVLGQELKIFKLKQLRNQILEYKLSNSNMYSELDLIKNLFEQKERELYQSINKVAELTKQIEQLRRIKHGNKSSVSNVNVSELDRLKQELQIRNKLNEQQAKKIVQQHELFNRKQSEVVQLDKRIDELKHKIACKRHKLNAQPLSLPVHSQTPLDASPSKQAAKFATKQQIANTYMNKDAYQKYQAIKLVQQFKDEECESSSASGASSSSSVASLSPQARAEPAAPHEHSDLPSHLKLEFDKLKYLPDMVKTIKKRHSISEMESSSTQPPAAYHKILDKHHNQLVNIEESGESSPLLSTFKPDVFSNENTLNSSSSNSVAVAAVASAESRKEAVESKPTRATKSIIKASGAGSAGSRRVNFDPHALLLDAAVEGELELVKKCSAQLADISEPNDEGITALHNSVCAGHFDIVRYLVETGCDINYADNDGWTPLHCAASCNNLHMIKFLVENGASVFATTISDNETAVKKCEEDEDGFELCRDYLLSVQSGMGSKECNGSLVHALYSYEPVEHDELKFDMHDQLVVLDKHERDGQANDGWWTCTLVNEKARCGLVPKNYLGIYPRIKENVYKDREESTIC